MEIIVCEDYNEISEKAAEIVKIQLSKKKNSVIGLASGATPTGLYKELTKMNEKGEISFEKVTAFALDEYYPIDKKKKQSYYYSVCKSLLSNINIKEKNVHLLNGETTTPEKECEEYEHLIEECGGIDLQILGIGQNGHIGFNEPDTNLENRTHLAYLTDSTINANSKFFEDGEKVPRMALTMGMGTILSAKKIILLASGTSKHRVLHELLNGKLNTQVPVSLLNLHTDVTVICDKDAYLSDRMGIDIGGTEIKFGIINADNKIIYKDSIPTITQSTDALVKSIIDKCNELMGVYNVDNIGIGTPGRINKGVVTSTNLPFKDTPLEMLIRKATDLPVIIGNDADCAALGEALCGAGKETDNMIMVTLGTGIGGGVIINNKVYHGSGAAGEIGHMSIDCKGVKCRCGLTGCWENYGSASALVKMAQKAAEENSDSVLGTLYKENETMNGRVFFKALSMECGVSKKVLDTYTDYVAVGINSLIKIFDPEMIVFSGGITNAGDALLNPIKKKIMPGVSLKISSLKSDAGIVGAALL